MVPFHAPLEEMYLLSLHNVSRASWQPELWYRAPSFTSLGPDVLEPRSEFDPPWQVNEPSGDTTPPTDFGTGRQVPLVLGQMFWNHDPSSTYHDKSIHLLAVLPLRLTLVQVARFRTLIQ